MHSERFACRSLLAVVLGSMTVFFCGVIGVGFAGTPAPCVVVDNGSGTVDLPPANCGYVSPTDLHMMIDQLDPGTAINIDSRHHRFINITRTPGGPLGGEVEQFGSKLLMNMQGTGDAAGYSRSLEIDIQCETHTAPRPPGPVQSFDTDMFMLDGQLPPIDPDFDLLHITAGTGLGMPSPGHTTLTQLPGGDWAVDSFFDVFYEIEWRGRPGGPLGGMSGSTTGTIRMSTGVTAGCPPIPAGTDIFPSTAKLVVQPCDPTAPSTSCVPMGPPIVLRASDAFTSPTVVQRGPHDTGAGTIPIELVSMSLTGSHPLIGPYSISPLGPSNPSLGILRNVVQDPTVCDLVSADTEFNVCAAVSVGPETWRNVDPLNGTCDPLELRAHINSLPPDDDRYENPFVRPVTLYDQATGRPRAIVYYELHHAGPPFPPPGTDCFDTTLTATVQLFAPPFNGPIFAQGPSMVQRRPSPNPDAIQTELIAMTLTGNAPPPIGPFQLEVALPPTPPSMGQAIKMSPPETYPVDSFFDVFFTLQTQQGPLHNNQPTHVQTQLDNLPPSPGSAFQSPPGQPTPLLSQTNQPVGQIRDVVHHIGPPEDWLPPPPPDDYCFDSLIVFRVEIFATSCVEFLTIPGGFRILRGGPQDPDGDGNETMDTLMIKKLLAGNSQCLGPFTGKLRPSSINPGSIRSMAPAEFFPADSFFDVFVDLDTAMGPVSTDPVHMQTTVNNLPPDNGEIYFGPGSVIPLRDGGLNVIGQISDIQHIIIQRVLPCPSDCLPRILWTSKTQARTAVPDGGGGATYDVVRGSLNMLRSSGGTSMTPATCLQNNGGTTFTDTPAALSPGQGLIYLSRDNFSNFVGTYNSSGAGQVGNRDVLAAGICPN